MRIAVLADIHGNVLALEAVLANLARRGGADAVVDLGDCVSGPLWPRDTMERLEALGARTVRGNHDRQVATLDPAAMGPSDRVAHAALSPEQRARLGALPPTLTVAPGILACHATPARDETYLVETVSGGRLLRDRPEAIARRLGDVGPARLVLCGHSHRTELVRLPGGVLIVNPGSVGGPGYADPAEPAHVSEAGSPHARYAVLDIPNGTAGEPVVTFLAVPYDNEAAARRAEAHGRPDWAMALRTGFMSL
ncbi:MAG TPA: metallophosphoesterase family protein [Microvirga sp.]|jgi:predicted phosphodiesterase|nr:metallophosphoesterase family protein [Microvirga sp.]